MSNDGIMILPNGDAIDAHSVRAIRGGGENVQIIAPELGSFIYSFDIEAECIAFRDGAVKAWKEALDDRSE